MTADYSDTPLAKKLSLEDGMRVWFEDMPNDIRAEIEKQGLVLSEEQVPTPGINAAHIFVCQRNVMEKHLKILRDTIDPGGHVWVSWPKKASGLDTDITEDTIRDVALPMGFVDIKVCAVDATWSGLKLVIRKELR